MYTKMSVGTQGLQPTPNTKLQSKVELVMLSEVRSEAEERNEASEKRHT